MKKKFFAIILAFAMLFTSLVSINDVSFAGDNAFEIYEDGVLKLSSSDVDKISTYESEAYTIKLLKDLVVPAESGHLKTITLKGNVTVQGKDYKISGERDGAAGDRLIKIEAGSKVTIDGLKLDGGDKYAGIEASGDDTELTFNSCTFKNFKAEQGAAIKCDEIKTLNIINKTTIIKCQGAVGPAIYCEGHNFTFNMNGSTVDSCEGSSSLETLTSSGIYLTSGDENIESTSAASILNSNIINCKSTSDDEGDTIHGALSLIGLKDTTISDSNLENNVITLSEGKNGYGAAIYCINTPLDIMNTSIKNNISQLDNISSANGGAVCTRFSPLNINDCIITGNKISVSGDFMNYNSGGAFKIDAGPCIIKNSNISNNSCDGQAGAIYF